MSKQETKMLEKKKKNHSVRINGGGKIENQKRMTIKNHREIKIPYKAYVSLKHLACINVHWHKLIFSICHIYHTLLCALGYNERLCRVRTIFFFFTKSTLDGTSFSLYTVGPCCCCCRYYHFQNGSFQLVFIWTSCTQIQSRKFVSIIHSA